jgi:aminoglycoside phosphotransferase family enzyme
MAVGGQAASAQSEVIAFLADPATYAPRPDRIETIETHGALVFLAGEEAIKIKRAVKLAYLDFSTLEKREAVCRREIEVNRPNAPEIYRDAVAITREPDGGLAIGGRGTPVEWAIRMARFGQEALLSTIAEQQGISDGFAASLADTVLEAHERAAPRTLADAAGQVRGVLRNVAQGITEASGKLAAANEQPRRFLDLAEARLARARPVLERRAAAGLVRRCHGDMHLGNIVLWQGRPQLFDAIEFDESLATIDLLYDLAFLLMDLDRRGQRRAARIVLDRYLAGTGRDLDLEGLLALPLFLGLRAAVRSLVAFDRARILSDAERRETEQHALETLSLAIGYLEPPPARLIAVGGLSGTGKTTLAAGLAPLLLPVPGALHLRSDILRKTLAGVGELERLPASAYTPEARARVYARLSERAETALGAGHSVVVDAVFNGPDERIMMDEIARRSGVRFDGLWLEAAPEVLKARVAARKDDASDATPAVVERQLDYRLGDIRWHRLPATGDPAEVLARARRVLGLTGA